MIPANSGQKSISQLAQFLGFEHFHEINSSLVKAVSRLAQASGLVERGEKLNVDLGVTRLVTVTVSLSTHNMDLSNDE